MPDTTPATEGCCPNCNHPRHLPGTECDGGVDHGPKRWHRCLCLARPGAALSCPPQMNCQGGTLGYSDIWYLQHGHSLMTADGVVSPEALKLTPVLGTTDQQPTTSDRAAAHGMEVTAYRQYRHDAAVEQIREAVGGLLAVTGQRVMDALEGTTDQQPETAPAGTELRDRIAAAIREESSRVDDLAIADAVLAVLPAPTDQAPAPAEPCTEHTDCRTRVWEPTAPTDRATEFELRDDTEIQAAAFRKAAEYAQQVAKTMATADEDWASRAGWACASVATGLRRMADEAQQPECTASISGSCLAERQSDGACDTEASECVHGGEAQQPECTCGEPDVSGTVHRTGGPCYIDEAQQPETEAHPAEHTWAAELHDPLADEWVPGTRYLVRERAVNHLEHSRKIAPTWKDGTPTQRRLVRATTTYTVVADEQPKTEAAK